jgi:anti-sigma regulatory factor (Ser/Thr protein kinase)
MAANKSFGFELKNNLSELSSLCEHLESIGNELGLSRKCLFEVNLALDELFTNIITYGFKDQAEHIIRVRLSAGPDSLTVTVEDDGIAFNPVERTSPDLACTLDECRVGGLGIHLMKNLIDDITYRRRGGKNILTMTKTVEKA